MNEDMIKTLQQENKHRTQHPYWVWDSIQMIPQMLSQCLEGETSQDIEKVVNECLKRKVNKLILVGRGSSYFAALATQPFIKKMTGLPVECYVTNVLAAYPYTACDSQTAVFFNSHSGKSEGDVYVVDMVKKLGAYTVGVTDIRESSLTETVDQVLMGPGGSKVELPATRTYATAIYRTLLFALALGKALGVAKDVDEFENALKALPAQVGAFIPAFEKQAAQVVDVLKDCTTLVIAGYGPNTPNAEEAAMAFNQSTGISSQSYEMENYIHGPMQALNKQTGMICIAPPSPLQERMFSMVTAARIIGAKTVLIVPEDTDNLPEVDRVVKMPPQIPDLISPVAYMLPLWQMGYHLGMLTQKGAHPDRLSMDKPEFKEGFSHIMKSDKWVTKK
jgi:glucosamine--fructose-6-phosphate aminotransferase (isomerizing)